MSIDIIADLLLDCYAINEVAPSAELALRLTRQEDYQKVS